MLHQLKNNLLFIIAITLLAQIAIFTAKAGLPVPEDVFQSHKYWESLGRAALEGLFTGILSVISIVAAAFGIEIRTLVKNESGVDDGRTG
jgi:hypothetical protein